MRGFAAFAALLLIAGCAPNQLDSAPENVTDARHHRGHIASPGAFGPLKIGTSFAKMQAEYPLKLQYSSEADYSQSEEGAATGTGCETFGIGPAWPGVSLMFEDGLLTRIDIYHYSDEDPQPIPHRTQRGVSVGMTSAEVKALYPGQLLIKPHPYTGDEGEYLLYAPEGRANESANAILFEANQGNMTNFRVGKLSSVQYIEGCL